MKSELEQLHDEVKLVRQEIQEIKAMLVPEVTPTREELKALREGIKEYERGEAVVWKGPRKRAVR